MRSFLLTFVYWYEYVVESGTVVAVEVFTARVTTDTCSFFTTPETAVLRVFFQVFEHVLYLGPLICMKVKIAVAIGLDAVSVKINSHLIFIDKRSSNISLCSLAKSASDVRRSFDFVLNFKTLFDFFFLIFVNL